MLIHLHQYRQVIAVIASQIHGRVTIHRGPSQASEHSKAPVIDRFKPSILSWTCLKRHRKINSFLILHRRAEKRVKEVTTAAATKTSPYLELCVRLSV